MSTWNLVLKSLVRSWRCCSVRYLQLFHQPYDILIQHFREYKADTKVSFIRTYDFDNSVYFWFLCWVRRGSYHRSPWLNYKYVCFSSGPTHFSLFKLVFKREHNIFGASSRIFLHVLNPILIICFVMQGEISLHDFTISSFLELKVLETRMINFEILFFQNFGLLTGWFAHFNKFVFLGITINSISIFCSGILKLFRQSSHNGEITTLQATNFCVIAPIYFFIHLFSYAIIWTLIFFYEENVLQFRLCITLIHSIRNLVSFLIHIFYSL